MEKDGIIFDLDGTLWDSSEQVVAAWNRVLRRQPDTSRQTNTAEIKSLMGKTMAEIYGILLPSLRKERQVQIAAEFCEEERQLLLKSGAVLFPGVPETLEKLSRSSRLFIVSNCQNGYIEAFLDHYGFNRFFTDTECFGRTGKCKGESIRILIGRNRLEKAAYVGDTRMDFEAAKLAGIPFIHAAYGFGTVEEASMSVQSFPELAAVVPEVL